MISFYKIFYVSFIELLVLLYFLYRYFMGSDPEYRILIDKHDYKFQIGVSMPSTGLLPFLQMWFYGKKNVVVCVNALNELTPISTESKLLEHRFG